MAQKDTVPDALRSHAEALTKALAVATLAKWNEDDDAPPYVDAEQPEAIGKALVKALRPELRNAKIGYLFRKTISRGGTTVWAQASKVGGKMHHFTHLDFLIEINWTAWHVINTPARKLALIDHELEHCGHNTETDKYVLVPHDIEEFSMIARRWGSWRPQLAQFANALAEGSQLGLFTHD